MEYKKKTEKKQLGQYIYFFFLDASWKFLVKTWNQWQSMTNCIESHSL